MCHSGLVKCSKQLRQLYKAHKRNSWTARCPISSPRAPNGIQQPSPLQHFQGSQHAGKSSSPKTISSSSLSSSGKSPFLRKKLFASKIIGSRIFKGNTPLSAFVLTLPTQMSGAAFVSSPAWLSSTAFSHSSQLSVDFFSSGTYATTASCSAP